MCATAAARGGAAAAAGAGPRSLPGFGGAAAGALRTTRRCRWGGTAGGFALSDLRAVSDWQVVILLMPTACS